MPGSEAQMLQAKVMGVPIPPRASVLSWDDYFMSVAYLTAMRSKDPATQVGACIVNDLNRIIGVGYNGFPSGVPNESLPWARDSPEGELETKYPYVVHAELNAIMNKNAESCRGCQLYCTLFPCNECAKVCIQSGIRKVIYASDKHHDRASSRASRRLFQLAGVETVRFTPRSRNLLIGLRDPEEEPLPEPLICSPTEEQEPLILGSFCAKCGCGCEDVGAAGGGSAEPLPEAVGPKAPSAAAQQPVGHTMLVALGVAAVAALLACRRQRGIAC